MSIAYWNESKYRFALHHGAITDTIQDWQEGDGPLDSADEIVVFREVDDQRLLVLTQWAHTLLEEDLVATTDATGLPYFIDGVPGVQQHMRERTGDATGDWDQVP